MDAKETLKRLERLEEVKHLLEDAKHRCNTVQQYNECVQAMHDEAKWASERIDKALEILNRMS